MFCHDRSSLISIHALREESDSAPEGVRSTSVISIHALREESDRQRTVERHQLLIISIHALREESDLVLRPCVPRPRNFNPRSP